MHNIPSKIINFIKNTVESWSIALEVKVKEGIGPIQLKQGILQGDSFCVRLFTLCLNPIAWCLRSTEGYTYSHDKQEKLTHLLCIRRWFKNISQVCAKSLTNNQDNKTQVWRHRAYLGSNKCATVDILRGKIKLSNENVQLSDTEELKVLNTNDHYKFLGKFENAAQLEESK